MPIVRVYGLRPTTPPGDLIAWQSKFTDLVRTLPGQLDACVHVAFPSDLLEQIGKELTIIVEGIRCVYGDGMNGDYRDRLALALASFLFDSVRPRPERVPCSCQCRPDEWHHRRSDSRSRQSVIVVVPIAWPPGQAFFD
jgi:hypothetical protein